MQTSLDWVRDVILPWLKSTISPWQGNSIPDERSLKFEPDNYFPTRGVDAGSLPQWGDPPLVPEVLQEFPITNSPYPFLDQGYDYTPGLNFKGQTWGGDATTRQPMKPRRYWEI